MRFKAAAILAVVFATMAWGANAALITYEFTVDITSGPLKADDFAGSFSFKSSSIIRGGTNTHTGLLTALSFDFNGVTYNNATANTGALGFNNTGTLTTALFGTNCFSGGCFIHPGRTGWFVSDPSAFSYSLSSPRSVGSGTVSAKVVHSGTTSNPLFAIPEPPNWMLLGTALAIGGVLRRRRRTASDGRGRRV
jgi:hypothetical protein